MKAIDLGMSYEVSYPSPSVGKPDEHYPSFHYEGSKHLDIPEEGVMLVRYKKIGSSESTRGDSTSYSCTIEVRSIEKVKGEREDAEDDAPTKKDRRSDEALDALMAERVRSRKDY